MKCDAFEQLRRPEIQPPQVLAGEVGAVNVGSFVGMAAGEVRCLKPEVKETACGSFDVVYRFEVGESR